MNFLFLYFFTILKGIKLFDTAFLLHPAFK